MSEKKDPLPSAPPNSCYSVAAMHDGGNLEDASPLICLGVCIQVCMFFHRWVCVPVMAVVHEEHDLKIKQQAFMCGNLVYLTDRWWTARSRLHSAVEAIWFCWSSPQSPNSSGSQTLVRGSGMCCKRCTLLDAEAGSYSEKHQNKSSIRLTCFLLTARA